MEDVIRTLNQEEENAVRKLAAIHGQISDATVELAKLSESLSTAYEDRSKQEDKAVQDALNRSVQVLEMIKGHYDEVVAFGNQVGDAMDSVKRLSEVVERASKTQELRSERVAKLLSKLEEREKRFEDFVKKENSKLEAKKKGIETMQKHITKRAAEVQSRMDALSAIKA